jgi:sugar O-acyltransferase (sialic acid O-acetyltransferase NeuD family)
MRPLIIIGDGGHAAVCCDLAHACGREVSGMIGYLDEAEALRGIDPATVELVNGVGSIGTRQSQMNRRKVYERLTAVDFRFAVLTHPSAVIAQAVVLEPGCVVMAGVIIQTRVRVGANTIVNTGAIVDHDCVLGRHAHIAPGAVLSGSVVAEDDSHVGTGARVIQGVRIGVGAVVGAGATVVSDVPSNSLAIGTPARPARKN